MAIGVEELSRGNRFKHGIAAKLRGTEVWHSEPESAVDLSASGDPVRITRIDIPFFDLLGFVFKIFLAQAIIAVPIALVFYLLVT